jgi:hypothetical protein
LKVKNNLFKKILKESIFNNSHEIVNGCLCLLFFNNQKSINYTFLRTVNLNLVLISVKLNNKLYSKNQLKKVITLNYLKNVKMFNKTLKNTIKKTYYSIAS